MKVIDGRTLAARIEERIRDTIKTRQLSLSLVSLFIGEAKDSALYTKRKAEAAERLGVSFSVEQLESTASAADIEKKIHELNARPNLDGYIMQLPLPEHLRGETDRLLNLIDPARDVDGLTEVNRERLLAHRPGAFLPTPVGAVVTILTSLFGTNLEGSLQFLKGRLPVVVPRPLQGTKATIISDGDVFGIIVKTLFEDGGVATTVERSDSPTLKDSLGQSKLVITAVGKPGLLTGALIAPASIVIDVGTTLVDGKTKGDVDWESITRRATAATPVPGGVGPVTVAMLYANLVYLRISQPS